VNSRHASLVGIASACVLAASAAWHGWTRGPTAAERTAVEATVRATAPGNRGPVVVRAPGVGPLPAPASNGPDALDEDDLETAAQRALEAAEVGVSARDIPSLLALRAKLDERSDDELLPERDTQALDLAIACLTEIPDAQQKAQAFFPDEPATALHIQVRDICLGAPPN